MQMISFYERTQLCILISVECLYYLGGTCEGFISFEFNFIYFLLDLSHSILQFELICRIKVNQYDPFIIHMKKYKQNQHNY